MKALKIILAFMFMSLVFTSAFAERDFISVPNSQAKIFYTIDSHWRMADDGNKPNQIRKIFTRNSSVKSSELDDSTPSMLMQVEDIKNKGNLDPIMYHVASLHALPPIHAGKYFSYADHFVKIKSVVGVYGFSVFEQNKKFIVSNVTFTFGTKGVKVIFMCPLDKFLVITKELNDFLSSLELQTSDVVPEIKEIQENGKIYMRYGDTGIVKVN